MPIHVSRLAITPDHLCISPARSVAYSMFTYTFILSVAIASNYFPEGPQIPQQLPATPTLG
jgi:hypothetical protein